MRHREVEDSNQRDKSMRMLRNLSIISKHKQKSVVIADL